VSRSDENPVYYVQYAHARVMSVLTQAGTDPEQIWAQTQALPGADADTMLSLLVAPREQQLINRLSEFPEIISTCATELSPHLMAFYLRDLSADFHAFYNSERVLVDDPLLRQARLLLVASVGQVLRSGLGLLGVSAPNRM
jgi:arginyl-tRNA synthetase